MLKLWNFFSFIGVEDSLTHAYSREAIAANRLNFIIIILLFLLNVITAIVRWETNGSYTIQTQKLLIMLILCVINVFFAFRKKHVSVIFILVFIPPLVLLFLPIFLGVTTDTDFIYGPLIIVALSIIPHIILFPDWKKGMYKFAFIFYGLLVLFFDNILEAFLNSNSTLPLSEYQFHIYYKIIFFSVFIFVSATLYNLRKSNLKYENELFESNEELKSTIEELKVTQQHIIYTEKMASLGTLTRGIAHEINNPLNFIRGGIYLLRDEVEVLKQHTQHYDIHNLESGITMVESGFSRSSEIIKALMTFANVGETGKKFTQLNDLVDHTILFMQSQIPSNIKIIKNYNLFEKVEVYDGMIHQVILHILDNALYSLNKTDIIEKVINITTKKQDTNAIVEIVNNGKSLNTEEINRLFDPFYTTKAQGEGKGLGLAVCYNILKEHNGYIKASNQRDGVSFEFGIPLKMGS